MGSIVKNWLIKKLDDRSIYHVTVMPCFDKKLEASREEFSDQTTQIKDIDCVITSSMYFFLFYFVITLRFQRKPLETN